jgi:hypothetical protein
MGTGDNITLPPLLKSQPPPHPRYNRIVRIISFLLLILCLAGCQHSGQKNADAVRQGVIDHLAKAKFDVSAMDVKVADVKFNGEQADATVAVTLKGKSDSVPMSFKYHLEHQNNQWVVVGRTGETSHGGGQADPNAGGANPHGGAMPPAGGGKMPSPQDLPPATKK